MMTMMVCRGTNQTVTVTTTKLGSGTTRSRFYRQSKTWFVAGRGLCEAGESDTATGEKKWRES